MKKFFMHLATARDGISYSLTKLIGISAVIVMLYKFIVDSTSDYLSFAGGIAAIMAAMAAKYFVEDKEKEDAADTK